MRTCECVVELCWAQQPGTLASVREVCSVPGVPCVLSWWLEWSCVWYAKAAAGAPCCHKLPELPGSNAHCHVQDFAMFKTAAVVSAAVHCLLFEVVWYNMLESLLSGR
jgi:hypothetical protein